jgi:hypothetical protein
VINNPGGHHAFEMIDDDEATRDAIERTIDFVKRATSARYQASLRRTLTEATAAANVIAANYHSAASLYAGLVEANRTTFVFASHTANRYSATSSTTLHAPSSSGSRAKVWVLATLASPRRARVF